ncbi:MAG: hypothetical protein IKN55_00180 [Oscillospiraceae bacterium]|nr:hypothetical protein [Oscillospiraceae bacterium]
MDNFILNNDTWLRYLPIVMYGLGIVLAALMVAIGFLIYRRYKNQNPKSHKHRSAFAMAYADTFAPHASSSVPLKRNDPPPYQQDARYTRVQQPATPIPDRPQFENERGVIEMYFEYEDEYKI